MGDTGRATIFALSSGPGRAAIAVIRVSGPRAGAALERLIGRRPAPRRASLGRVRDPESGEQVDEALVLWLPGPRSETGEDMAELHVHGGRAVIDGVLEVLARQEGLRPAEPGEFTRRAFDNGRIDLTAAEGIADLIDAETPAQRRQALRQSLGALAETYEDWRARLVAALARLEADIDFPDEELPEDLAATVMPELAALRAEMARHLADGGRGEVLREGFQVAIVGAPNAGKSSLLNRLARREAAIVAETAGTTRDVVEVHLDLGGFPVVLADTAGLREEAADAPLDPVEREGIRRSLERAGRAQLRLAVFDATRPPDAATLALVDQARALAVVNKCDLAPAPAGGVGGVDALAVSARTGEGIDGLVAALAARAEALWSGQAEAPALTRARHRAAVTEAVEALERAEAAALPELTAEDVRLAARAVGRITGRVDVEELLDAIFREFCIGK